MDSINSSAFNSPKRKRGVPDLCTITPSPPSSSPPRSSPQPQMQLNTNIPGVVLKTKEDGQPSSPRTKVAYNFQGLRLDGGYADKSELDDSRKSSFDEYGHEYQDNEEESLRKRVKVLEPRSENKIFEIPETPQNNRTEDRQKEFSIFIGPERMVDPVIGEKARGVVLSNEVDPILVKGCTSKAKEAGMSRPYPSINRLADSKSRVPKKRAGTPPLVGNSDVTKGDAPRNLDPDRAALTWHDDEITGHDPNDPDDDGEGINGIGFKPTPAEAYARTQKRRQQMAEYRNREAREARKARSERRRGSGNDKATSDEVETARRVRFMEAEVKSMIPTS